MDSRKKVITLKDLDEAVPKLRMQLRPYSSKSAIAPRDRVDKFKDWLKGVLSGAENDMELEYGNDLSKKEENKEKLQLLFQKMRNELDANEEQLLNEMDGMTLDQQEQLLYFWKGVQILFSDLLDYIKKAFDFFFEKIKAGFILLKETVKGLFAMLADLVKGAHILQAS